MKQKPVVFSKDFDKAYAKRIKRNEKLVAKFKIRLALFVRGERANPINDHPLTGKLEGKRAFSITSDIRVIYEELEDEIIFIDIGSHNQVY